MKRKTGGLGKTGKLHRRLRRDNRGSAIVIVIIAMAMIGILASAILWSAYMNYMIKINDIRNKKSFYSAETVMEQIVAGLEHEASAAITLSYQEVMQNWNPNGTQDEVVQGEADRSSRFTTVYLSSLIKSLMLDTSPVPGPIDPSIPKQYHYDREKLAAFIDDELYDRMDEEVWNGKEEGSSEDDNTMEIVNNSSLVLHNIRVSFMDDRGYVSIINTDICIDVPELVFYQNPSIDSLYDYALIGNTGVETAENSGKSVVYGGIYAGREDTAEAAGKGGLTVKPGSGLTVEGGRYVISGGDITVGDKNGAGASLIVNSKVSGSGDTSLIPEVYAVEINVTGGSSLSLDSKTYVADDLVLSGRGSRATLMREYYGYGYFNGTSVPNDSDDEGKKRKGAEASSAILINGTNATLDMSGVTRLMLAGRAYIGETSLGASSILPETKKEQLVVMGESIAVKGSQIAYLVPAECIGTLDQKTVIGQNPLNGEMASAIEEYKAAYGEEAFKEVDVTKPVYKLGNKSLSDFNITKDDIRKVYTQYNSSDSENKTLLYYYLVLEEDEAVRYFEQYYDFNTNKEAIDNYFGKYAGGGITLGNYESPATQYTILGNSLVSDVSADGVSQGSGVKLLKGMQQPKPGEGEEGGEEQPPENPEEEGYPEISDNTSEMENAKTQEDVWKLAEEYEDTFTALTTNLTKDLAMPEPDQNVFNSIILEKELRDHLAGSYGNGGTIEVTSGAGLKAVLTDEDYTVKDSKVRLVVAVKDKDGNGGNVTVSRNFKGLIIAQGTITLTDGVEINKAKTKSEESEIRRELYSVLNEAFPEGTSEESVIRTPLSFFVNGGGTLSEEVTGTAKVDENGVLNVDLSEIVRYMNWIKK